MNKILAVCTTAVLAVGIAIVGASPATATGDNGYECVPRDAYTEVITPEIPATPGTPAIPAVPGTPEIPAVYETVVIVEAGWQRYSWTGGPIEEGVVPTFPSEHWQANVAGDPHRIGVEGAYDVSRGSSGNSDWFYLEAIAEVTEQRLVSPAIPATPGTPEIPAVPGTPAIPAVTIDHPAIVCDDPDPEPTLVTPLPPTFDDFCGTENDKVNVPSDTESVSYSATQGGGTATVTATAKAGYAFPEETPAFWAFEFSDEACPVEEPVVVVPEEPVYTDKCGTEEDSVVVPISTDEIAYAIRIKDDGGYVVTATPRDGFVFAEGTTSEWTLPAFTDEACPVVVVPPTEEPPVVTPPVVTPPVVTPPTVVTPTVVAEPVDDYLAYTGTESAGILYGVGAAFLLLMAGAATLLFRRRAATE